MAGKLSERYQTAPATTVNLTDIVEITQDPNGTPVSVIASLQQLKDLIGGSYVDPTNAEDGDAFIWSVSANALVSERTVIYKAGYNEQWSYQSGGNIGTGGTVVQFGTFDAGSNAQSVSLYDPATGELTVTSDVAADLVFNLSARTVRNSSSTAVMTLQRSQDGGATWTNVVNTTNPGSFDNAETNTGTSPVIPPVTGDKFRCVFSEGGAGGALYASADTFMKLDLQ